jgi:hypothetical protein
MEVWSLVAVKRLLDYFSLSCKSNDGLDDFKYSLDLPNASEVNRLIVTNYLYSYLWTIITKSMDRSFILAITK